jgi:hypothetical protein
MRAIWLTHPINSPSPTGGTASRTGLAAKDMEQALLVDQMLWGLQDSRAEMPLVSASLVRAICMLKAGITGRPVNLHRIKKLGVSVTHFLASRDAEGFQTPPTPSFSSMYK